MERTFICAEGGHAGRAQNLLYGYRSSSDLSVKIDKVLNPSIEIAVALTPQT